MRAPRLCLCLKIVTYLPYLPTPPPPPLWFLRDDFGHTIFGYYCPLWYPPSFLGLKAQNIQSIVLIILYFRLFYGIFLRRKTDGALIFQRLLHISSLVFLTRTTTVGITNLPQPNPRCIAAQQQQFSKSYLDAIKFVMGRGFPPHACGDLIYSGHVACTLVCFIIMHRHNFFYGRYMLLDITFQWSMMCLGIYSVIACRSHYTVDVVLAFYFSFFISGWYHLRTDGILLGKASRFIAWLECPKVLIKENDFSPKGVSNNIFRNDTAEW